MSNADTPDWEPVPGVAAVGTAIAAVSDGGTTTIVTPPAGKGVRLFAAFLRVSTTATASDQFAAILMNTTPNQYLLIIDCAPGSTNEPVKTANGQLFYGGVVLPRNAAVQVTCGAGVNTNAQAGIVYALV